MRLTQERRRRSSRGQALLEFALVFPFFMLILMSIIVLGLYVFYNQQLENAAREAARYAAVHSTGAQCPTVSWVNPGANGIKFRCDAQEDGWLQMRGAAQSKVWGMPGSAVSIVACWSGFVDPSGNANAQPVTPNVFTPCTINRIDPRTHADDIACPAPATIQGTTDLKADGDDKSAALAYYNGTHFPTTVTVYACYRWTPPMSGFLFIPQTVTLRAVITEAMQRQGQQ
jgi:hypothetical protein